MGTNTLWNWMLDRVCPIGDYSSECSINVAGPLLKTYHDIHSVGPGDVRYSRYQQLVEWYDQWLTVCHDDDDRLSAEWLRQTVSDSVLMDNSGTLLAQISWERARLNFDWQSRWMSCTSSSLHCWCAYAASATLLPHVRKSSSASSSALWVRIPCEFRCLTFLLRDVINNLKRLFSPCILLNSSIHWATALLDT